MANDIKCTCGHSWSKASSSKKDMYVCHICGKDNTMQDGGWLSKFEQGGMTLEQKDDNYGIKPNPNDVQASVGPDFVGLGYDTTGRNYSPAWGGQFQSGGNLWNTNKTAWVDSIHNARKGDLNFVQRMFDQRAGSIQIPGQPGTSTHYMESGDGKAYPTVVQMPNGKLQYLNQNDKDAAWKYANKTGQFIKFPNDEQAEWYANNGYKKGTNVLKKAMGGSLPGAVGFTYARTINPAPSNGKYAKKTKASAQDGKEVTYTHQPGMLYDDFEPIGPGERYMLKRTVTPYTSKRDIKKFTQAPTDPRQVNFLSNYAGAIGEPLSKGFKYPTSVPYEDEKHWNIDRFIIDPQFVTSEKLNTTESTKEEMKKNVLADMYKYYMLQNEGDRDDAWKQAKKFVRQEINPRVKGEVYDEYLRKDLPIPNIMGITSLVDNSYLQKYNSVRDRTLSETTDDDDAFTELMQKNPLSKEKAFRVGMDWLMNYKGLSRKEAKKTLNKTKELPKYEQSDAEPMDMDPSKWKDGGTIVDPMGQWAHPGEVTIIPGTDITMEGVDYPVLGISDTGDQQMMYPGEDYDFDGEYVTEYPMMQEGGWLSKYQEKVPSDATRVAAPVRLTDKEQKQNVRINKQTQKNTEEYNKAVIADRKSKIETKGDINVPGSFNLTEKLRLFPESVGGVGEIIDEYLNPGIIIGPLADSLGESIAARSPEGVAATLAMTAGAGALGFDPLGSALKVPGKVAKSMKSGLLSNAYKLNPYAFKANPEAYYHRSPNLDNIVNKETGLLQGFGQSPAGREFSERAYSRDIGNVVMRSDGTYSRINLLKPANSNLYFSKGVPLDGGRYNSPKLGMTGQGYPGPYMVEVKDVPMGSSVKGRKPKTYAPSRPEGYAVSHRPISIDEAKFYKEDWLKGYKEVPKKENGGWLTKYK